MRTRLCIALAALIGTTAFAPAPFEKKDARKKDDLKNMAGTWTVIRYERGGAAVNVLNTTLKAKVEGSNWNFFHMKPGGIVPSSTYTFTLDPKKSPGWLDMTLTTSTNKLLGIYRFDGAQLQIAFHTFGVNERPGEFTGTDKRVFHMTLKRDKP